MKAQSEVLPIATSEAKVHNQVYSSFCQIQKDCNRNTSSARPLVFNALDRRNTFLGDDKQKYG